MMNKRRSCVQDLIRPKTPTISGIPTQGSLQPQQPFFQGPKPHRASTNVPKDIPAGGDFSSWTTHLSRSQTNTEDWQQPSAKRIQVPLPSKEQHTQNHHRHTLLPTLSTQEFTLEHSKSNHQVTCPKSTSSNNWN